METRIEKLNEENRKEIIEEAGKILQNGGLVAFPTETVYGLGANALDAEAAAKTYRAKGRPSDNPLIVHIADWEDLKAIVKEIPPQAELAARSFWPGPLTMIFQKSDLVPYGTTGGLDTVAVRMPSNETALEVIRAAGGYVSGPSANTSGRPSPTNAGHVAEDLSGKIDMILDDGDVEIGLESTILDMTVVPPMILRPGAITKEMAQEVLGEVDVDQTILSAESKEPPKAPGMKYRHYAPKADLVIVEGTVENEVKAIRQLVYGRVCRGEKAGVIATTETQKQYTHGLVKVIGTRSSEKSVARNLYAILRDFDREDVRIIYSESFAVQGLGRAIMNRLEKAAGHQKVDAEAVIKQQKYHKIIFVSESDVIRGPMAAEMLRNQKLDKEYDILSRGLVVLFPEPVNQKVEVVMKSHGLLLDGYMSNVFSVEETEKDTLILTMDEAQKKSLERLEGLRGDLFTLEEFTRSEEEMPQPIGQPLDEYEKCYQKIAKEIETLTKILNEL